MKTGNDIYEPMAFEKRCKFASIIENGNDVFAYISDADNMDEHNEAVDLYRRGMVKRFFVHEYKFGVYGNLTVEQKKCEVVGFCKQLGVTIV